jgi:hypothetical protein
MSSIPILRIGRDFNISSKAGIDIYTGLSFQFYHNRFTKVEQNAVYEDYENYVQISLGISYYYKLQ